MTSSPTSRATSCAAWLLTVILVASRLAAGAEQPTVNDWLGKRVIQRHNNFPLRLENGDAVLRSGTEIHIYKVERIEHDRLWLVGEDDGPSGWGSPDQFVRLEDASTYLASRIRAHPTETFLYSLMAVIHDDRKEFDRAMDDWNKIVELEPDNPESYAGRARRFIDRLEWDKAITDINRAITLEPNDAFFYRIRAHVWNAKREYDKVISDCDRSIELEPKNATGLVTRAQAWLNKSEYDKAIADATKAVAIDASSALAFRFRGLAWSRKKEYTRAIADFNTAIGLDPEDSRLYYNRAWAWQQQGDQARAMADYATGVELDPERELPGALPPSPPSGVPGQKEPVARSQNTLPLEHATTDVRAKDPAPKDQGTGVIPAAFNPVAAPPTAKEPSPSAITNGVQAPTPLTRDSFGIVEPQTARDFTARAGDWLRIKEYDKAIADCDQAVELGSHDPLARIYRGLAWREKNENDKAIADYDQAIAIEPQNAFAFYARSSAWSAKKEYGKASADLAQAARLAPDNPLTKNGQAWTWATCPDANCRDGKKAVEAATSACELTKWAEAGLIDTLAAAYAEVGDFDSAIKWQTRAIELETDAKNKDEYLARIKLYREKKPYRDMTR